MRTKRIRPENFFIAVLKKPSDRAKLQAYAETLGYAEKSWDDLIEATKAEAKPARKPETDKS